jgi:hypothetical protein
MTVQRRSEETKNNRRRIRKLNDELMIAKLLSVREVHQDS